MLLIISGIIVIFSTLYFIIRKMILIQSIMFKEIININNEIINIKKEHEEIKQKLDNLDRLAKNQNLQKLYWKV